MSFRNKRDYTKVILPTNDTTPGSLLPWESRGLAQIRAQARRSIEGSDARRYSLLDVRMPSVLTPESIREYLDYNRGDVDTLRHMCRFLLQHWDEAEPFERVPSHDEWGWQHVQNLNATWDGELEFSPGELGDI